uniref:Uncharacterized protein n=1 Tax=Lutzomyia longipalpis TaxID=7200 RepID=A0A1B0CLP2_LUTLO
MSIRISSSCHKEWRRRAKKLRRKRIRQQAARKRDEEEAAEEEKKLKDPTYLTWLAEQRALELFQEEEDELRHKADHQMWLDREKEAQQHFREQQETLEKFQAERMRKNILIRQEYKAEQERRKRLREEQKRIEEERRRMYEVLMEQIELYIAGKGDLPAELLETANTNPERPECPFFTKTGACRFGDQCSRNHSRPNISCIIIIPNFYTHILLEQYRRTEYGGDSALEYDEREMEEDFLEFYEDVLPEFELFGTIENFFVCRNREPHLRGNVYVEYKSKRDAIKAYRKFQGRYYGGKQLNVGFRNIESWSTAICGI